MYVFSTGSSGSSRAVSQVMLRNSKSVFHRLSPATVAGLKWFHSVKVNQQHTSCWSGSSTACRRLSGQPRLTEEMTYGGHHVTFCGPPS